jgi:hypothetical protein
MKFKNVSLAFALLIASSTTFVAAQEKEATAKAVGVPAATIGKMNPITVTVELIGGQKINGTLTEVTMLPIRAAFGEASVPLSEVAGVKLASAEDSSTTIIMKNGDSITGATDLKVLAVDTEWGSAKINGSSVTSILLLPDLKWNATVGLNGRRWSLVDGKASGSPTGPSGTTIVPGTTVTRPGTTTTTPGTSRVVPN